MNRPSLRLLLVPLAVSFTLPAGAAFAVTAYDARTLGMGGSSVGYSGNASLAYWNPAAVGMSKNLGVFLPTFAMSLSNNVLSPGDVAALTSSLTKGSSGGDFSQIFNNLGSSQGLNLQAQALVEPIGISLGKVGPGSMAFRLDGEMMANAHLSLSKDFSQNLNSLFFQNGFTDIANAVKTLSDEAANPTGTSQSQLNTDVSSLKTLLDQNMSAFIKRNGAGTTTKTLVLNETAAIDAAAAVTYAQPIPVKIPALPKSEITVGATAKIFGAPGSLLANTGSISLPGGTSAAKISPLGGGAGATVSLDIDKEVTDLADAIDAFQANQNIATTADLAAKTGAFLDNGLAKSNLQFSSLTPDSVGVGMDLGAAMKIDDVWSVGLALQNPLLLWNATKTTYKYDFSGDAIKLLQTGNEKVAFRDAEPFVTRAGVAYQPVFGGNPALGKGWLFNAGIEAPFTSYGTPPSISLGVEKTFFDAFALRLGTSQWGLAPLYTAGLGVQTRAFQMNLGAGVDNPTSSVKALAAAFSIGAGF